MSKFKEDIGKLEVVTNPLDNLDIHAPESTKTINVSTFNPWYDDDVKCAKAQRKKAERAFIKNGKS